MTTAIESVFSEEEIRQRVQVLGAELSAALTGDGAGDSEPLLLALLGGSVIFLADLVRTLPFPVRYEFVHVAYRQPEVSASEMMEIVYPLAIDLEGQDVLVVKDVVASAIPESYLALKLRDKGARRVRFVTLIDLPDERKAELDVDFRAFAVRRAGPLVGYGLKHEGRWGNLPYVGRVAEAVP